MTKSITEQEKYLDIIERINLNYLTMKNMRPIEERLTKRYYDDFAIVNCHNSNAIEGNTFTYDETYLLLHEGVAMNNHSIKEHNEIQGYDRGFWYVYNSLKENVEISEDFISNIHKDIVMGEHWGGQYRNIDVVVGNMVTAKVDYEPPTFTRVRPLMQEYIQTVNEDLTHLKSEMQKKDIDWIKVFSKLGEHHCKFERIHPYEDGNGRTGRLLLTYELIHLGLLPCDIRYEERERYYAALKHYDTKLTHSSRPESKTEGIAKLLMECESRSMEWWNKMFIGYIQKDVKKNEMIEIEPLRIFEETSTAYKVKICDEQINTYKSILLPKELVKIGKEDGENGFIIEVIKELAEQHRLTQRVVQQPKKGLKL